MSERKELTRMEEHHCKMIEQKAGLLVENGLLHKALQSSREDVERLAEALREIVQKNYTSHGLKDIAITALAAYDKANS